MVLHGVHDELNAAFPQSKASKTGGDPVESNMAVVQSEWFHFGIGAPPILVYFSGDWDVHWGYGVLTHDHI